MNALQFPFYKHTPKKALCVLKPVFSTWNCSVYLLVNLGAKAVSRHFYYSFFFPHSGVNGE